MGQEDKTGKLKQKARPKKSVVKGTESEAGQAAVKHGVKQRENPEQQVESIELIDKQVKEKEETLRQKQHEIKLMMEKEIVRSYAQPNIQQEKMLRKLKRNYARQLKLLDQIKDLNDLRSPGKEGPLQRGEKPNVKRQKKEKSGDGVKRGHPGPAWRPLLCTYRVAQVVPGRQVVFQHFQLERVVKRMVRNRAHLRPIDPMPALISTALHNLCICASICARVRYEPGPRGTTWTSKVCTVWKKKKVGWTSHYHHPSSHSYRTVLGSPTNIPMSF